jgi:hypothetical protein
MYQCNVVSGDSHAVFKGRMKLEVLSFAAMDAELLYTRPSHLVCIISGYFLRRD